MGKPQYFCIKKYFIKLIFNFGIEEINRTLRFFRASERITDVSRIRTATLLTKLNHF